MPDLPAHAEDCIARCHSLALHTEEPGFTTRTFLCEPMRGVHNELGGWMRKCGMAVTIDGAGNLRGFFAAEQPNAATLFIGSHLDTVPHAGSFDGILGVVLAVKLVELSHVRRFSIEVLGFSEEEGVRFSFPFIGSRAFTGELDSELLARRDARGVSVETAIREFGLDAGTLDAAVPSGPSLGYLEFHIEQGPVLESLGAPLGVVEAIAGQTRMSLAFEGRAGHAGTTPMHLRRDALAGASEWVIAVEREAAQVKGVVATVGRIEAHPGAPNVIPGLVKLSLDVRHAEDAVRSDAVRRLVAGANTIASRRSLRLTTQVLLAQAAVAMDLQLTNAVAQAIERSGGAPHRMVSGAGHDAMIIARHMPAAMLFLRSPGGISHHPDESVLTGDVADALSAGLHFLDELESAV